MTNYGFTTTEPEYLAAELYFGQSPAPQYLWIGRQDTTAIQSLIPHAGNAGTGYAVGNTVSIIQSGASYGTATVAAIGSGGSVTSLTPLVQGTGYSVGSALTTTTITGSGINLEVDITAVGETPLQAVVACRNANTQWYICIALAAGNTDHEAIAPYIQAASPASVYFYSTQDLTGVAAQALQASGYRRTLGITSTTQSGAYPNNAYAAAAVMGVAMGLNSGLASSYFVLMFKQLAGVAYEPLTSSQVTTLLGYNTNLYLSYNNTYLIFQNGQMASGAYFDQILGIDQLVSALQYACMNVFIDNLVVPLTNAGEVLLINACNGVCQQSVTQGFLAPGTWTGATILNVEAGTALPNGFLVQSQSYTLQSAGARAARQAMPLYITVILADGAQSLAIELVVQS